MDQLLGNAPFFLGFGDILFDIDLKRMEKFHREHQAEITVFAHPNDHPVDSDVLILNSQKKIINILKKNEPRVAWYDNCVNAGLYIIQPQLIRRIAHGMKTDLEKDIILPLIRNGGAVYGYSSPEYVKDVGTLERITEAESAMQSGMVRFWRMRWIRFRL